MKINRIKQVIMNNVGTIKKNVLNSLWTYKIN